MELYVLFSQQIYSYLYSFSGFTRYSVTIWIAAEVFKLVQLYVPIQGRQVGWWRALQKILRYKNGLIGLTKDQF